MKTPKMPLYQSLASSLRDRIHAQKWKPGDLMPSEIQLCREFGVSRGTAIKAIELLISEGLVHRKQGVGTFVARPALHRMPGNLTSFTMAVKSQGRTPSQRILEMRQLSRREALAFHCGEPALFLERLRNVDDIAWSLHQSVVPLSIAIDVPQLQSRDAGVEQPTFSLYEAFSDAGFVIDHADEAVGVRLATEEEAKLLGVELPAALMIINRNSFDPDGRLLEASEAKYLSGCYSYETRIVRASDVSILPVGSALQKMTSIDND